MPADSLQMQVRRDRRGRFALGRSGNPAGRAPGSRNKATALAEAMLEGEAAALTRAVIERALAGDATAMRLCFERLVAPRRERAVEIALPPIRDAGDLAAALAAIAAAAAAGAITPGEAMQLSQSFETLSRAIDASDFDRRLRLLEDAYAAQS